MSWPLFNLSNPLSNLIVFFTINLSLDDFYLVIFLL